MALGIGTNTKGVQRAWDALIVRYGSEVTVLIDADVKGSGADERVINAILAFREGKMKVIPGGGGRYGRIEISGDERAVHKESEPQRSLLDF